MVRHSYKAANSDQTPLYVMKLNNSHENQRQIHAISGKRKKDEGSGRCRPTVIEPVD